MASRTPSKKAVMFKIVCTFEPNRLSSSCLANAYELALPLIAKNVKLNTGKSDEINQDEIIERGVINHG